MRINEFELIDPMSDVQNTITRLVDHHGSCDDLSPRHDIIMSDILLLQTDLAHNEMSFNMTEVKINAYCPRCRRHGSGWIETNGWFSAVMPSRGAVIRHAMDELPVRKNRNGQMCEHRRLMMSSAVRSKDIAFRVREENTRNYTWFKKRKALAKQWFPSIGSDEQYHLVWCPDCFAMTCVNVGRMSFTIYNPSKAGFRGSEWY